jgi:hypothetical protein
MAQWHGDGGGGDRAERFLYMQVSDMWDMLRYHDNTAHRQAMEGWRQAYELVLMHRTQVEKYKEKLITAWPPSRNKAAAAYVERLDNLIENLTETYDAAIANHRTYTTAIAAVDAAKWTLDRIQQEHAANQTALNKYTAELAARPVHYGKYVVPETKPSPVASGRQEELHQQAVTLMTSLTVELAQAQTALVSPRPYSPNAAFSDSTEPLGTGGSSPILPTLQMSLPGRSSSSARVSAPGISGTGAKTTPSSGEGTQPGPVKQPTQGPILGGTKQPVIPPVTGNPPLTPTTPSTSAPDSFNFTPTQGTPATPPRYPTTIGTPSGGIPVGTSPSAIGTRGSSPLNGGVIGGTQPIGGAPSSRAGRSGAGTRGSQGVNPLGGMIGQEANTPTGRRVTSRREQEARSLQWDPDNPWETDSGIDPVLAPLPEQRINPGPTIGGR